MKGKSEVSGPRNTRFHTIRHVESTTSTNTDLLAEARAGAPAGLVEVADHQSQGRGRSGREWLDDGRASVDAEPQAAMFSALIRPSLDGSSAGLIPLVVGCAVRTGLVALGAGSDAAGPRRDGISPGRIGLKWPNDLMWIVDGQAFKLAGILVETIVSSSGLAAVIGIGVNLAPPPVSPLTARGIGLAQLGGAPPSRDQVVASVLASLDHELGLLESGTWSLDAYRAVCSTLGQVVDMDTPAGPLSGRAVDVAPDGQLLIDDGRSVVAVAAGDVHQRVT